VDKLQFIYINQRVLQNISVTQVKEEDTIVLEDALLEAGESAETNPSLNGGQYALRNEETKGLSCRDFFGGPNAETLSLVTACEHRVKTSSKFSHCSSKLRAPETIPVSPQLTTSYYHQC
jgi:hypothetical protein